MSLLPRWRGVFGSRARVARRKQARRRGIAPSRLVPAIELLEQRILLSTFTVQNLADSGAGSLRQAIQDANDSPGPDLINFAKGVKGTIGLTSGELPIDSDLTIDGPGAHKLTVSGNRSSRVFNVIGGSDASMAITVSISGLTVSHGRAIVNAGGIANDGFSDLTLSRMVLWGNEVVGLAGTGIRPRPNGGAIQNNGIGANLTIIESLVTGNTAHADPNGLFESFGGGITNLNGATLAVANSIIAGNQVFGATLAAGGGIHQNVGSKLTLLNSIIAGNRAVGNIGGGAGWGGGISNSEGFVSIVSSWLTDNRAIGGDGGSDGTGLGGAISNDEGEVCITDSSFTNNRAVAGSGGLGRAHGGAVGNVFGFVSITGGSFKGNWAVADSGQLGDANGGAILNFVGTLSATRSSFMENRALGGDGFLGSASGGGIRNIAGSVFLTNSSLANNRAIGRDGAFGIADGGGISNDSGDVSITDSGLTGNRAVGGDGGVNVGDDFSVGAALGGGISNFAGQLQVNRSTLRRNQALGGNNNTHHAPNTADVGVAHGGAIFNNLGGEMLVRNSIIEHNQAIGGRGNTGSGPVAFVGAGTGGGIDNSLDPALIGLPGETRGTIIDSTIRHNEAIGGDGNTGSGERLFVGAGLGGGLANYLGVITDVSGTSLTHNRAIGGSGNLVAGGSLPAGLAAGGAVFNGLGNFQLDTGDVLAPSIVNLSHSTLEHNKARGGQGTAGMSAGDGWGGAIANLFDADTTVVNSLLAKNRAIGGEADDGGQAGNGYGGGAYNDSDASLTLRRSTVTKNHAHGGEGDDEDSDGEGIGGGIYNLGTLDFDEFTLIRKNHASTSEDDVFG